MKSKNKLLLSITVFSSCAVMGTVLATGGVFNKNDTLAVTRGSEIWHHYAAVAATPTRHGSSEFWAKGSENCMTPYYENPGVSCIEHDFSTYEAFYNMESTDPRYIAPTTSSPIDNGNGTVTYGIYPQTYLNNTDDIYSTLDSDAVLQPNGWYKYQGEYYAKTAVDNNNWFRDGTPISQGSTYWFKCEPIVWNKLSDYESVYYLLSSLILDANFMFFGSDDAEPLRSINEETVYPNNYKYSEVRSWLNGYNGTEYKGGYMRNMNFTGVGFIDTAFVLGDSAVQLDTVNNSAITTDEGSASYACDNTTDKVFLPSYFDLKSGSHGFVNDTSASSTRICKTTDWSIARGVADDQNNNGYYWTRSPNYTAYNDTEHVWMADRFGAITSSGVFYDGCGVRPGIKAYIPD